MGNLILHVAGNAIMIGFLAWCAWGGIVELRKRIKARRSRKFSESMRKHKTWEE